MHSILKKNILIFRNNHKASVMLSVVPHSHCEQEIPTPMKLPGQVVKCLNLEERHPDVSQASRL